MSTSTDFRTFSDKELRACETLFPLEIDRDPWVQYHATSSINEDQIDAEGLKWSPAICSAADVLDLVLVYRSMNWCGKHTGGYVALDSFSVSGDFQGNETKPIYFREFSLRSLMYAQREFAGGESARGIRYALRDLDRYLADEAVRDEHYQYQRREAIGLASSGALPPRVMRVDLDRLKRQVERFADLRERCEGCQQSHRHGVVYAVRFTPEDIPSLNYSSSMGIRCYKPIGRQQIVGKVRVLADDSPVPAGNNGDIVWKNHWRREDPSGLLVALENAEKDGKSFPTAAPDMVFRHRRQNLLDPAAGIDESEEIARVHGSPQLAEFVRQHRQG